MTFFGNCVFFFDADKADLMSQLVPYEVPYLPWGLDDTELDTMYADNLFTKSPMVSFYLKKKIPTIKH